MPRRTLAWSTLQVQHAQSTRLHAPVPRYGLNVLIAAGEHEDNIHSALYDELDKGICARHPGSTGRSQRTSGIRGGALP
jgi:hypothetical protein